MGMGMGYTYTPAYYSSLQDSITSICKSILPFSFKNRRLPAAAAEQKLSKHQSDNLKWQQNSFHQILYLMGLHKEGILPHTQLSAFKTHLLDTLKGPDTQHPSILRDRLLFLQELLYAKCITEEEYHASKRPLLQRLAVQGAELEVKDVIVGTQKQTQNTVEEEWSEIDLRDEQTLISKEPKNKLKQGLSSVKHIKEAASAFGFGAFRKLGKTKEQKSIFDVAANCNQFPADNARISNNDSLQSGENPFWNETHSENESETKSILMPQSLSLKSDKFGTEECQGKKAVFRGPLPADKSNEKDSKSARKQWGFDGFKRWNTKDETAPLPLGERLSTNDERPYTQGPETKQIKRKLLSSGSSSGFYIDKVVGNNIKKELSRIQSELSSTNPNFKFSNDQMDAISTKLPVDKTDLKQFFPRSWCEKYGDVVLDVVKKEFKDHVGEMETMRNAAWERRCTNSKRWTTFEDDQNSYPNHTSPVNIKPVFF